MRIAQPRNNCRTCSKYDLIKPRNRREDVQIGIDFADKKTNNGPKEAELKETEMKKIFALVLTAIATTVFAQAGVFNVTPADKDLSDLDHYSAYSWGIDFTVPKGEIITGATLSIKNIWDWTKEDNDILQIRMLDNPGKGVKYFHDDQKTGDYFAHQGVAVGTWTDPVGGYARGTDISFDLGKLGLLNKLNQYAADGQFGFSFDPDCHYFNDGVHLQITTKPVPEPGTMIALGAGALALLRRRRKA